MILLILALGTAGSQTAAKLPPKIGYAELSSVLSGASLDVLLLDVRTDEEFKSGHITGAKLAPYDGLAASFSEENKDRPIVVYCRSGRRSAIAQETLSGMGYRQVSDFGGIGSWKGTLVTGD